MGEDDNLLCIVSHLFVGVKLFVRLMSEPAIETREKREDRQKNQGNTQTLHLLPFQNKYDFFFNFFISEIRIATQNDAFKQQPASPVAGEVTSPARSTQPPPIFLF